MPSQVIPTGIFRVIPAGNILFSTTDALGKITGANRNFCEISAFPIEQLVGAPHNIVRHPDMPGGLFQLFWRQLQQQLPIAAYVVNLASDGSSYWTLACASPVSEGQYLSVRVQVSRPDHHGRVSQVYDSARAAERKMRSAGMSAHDAATESSRIIEGLFAEHGYAGFAGVAAAILSDEVDVWIKAPQPDLPALPGNEEPRRVLAAAREIDVELAAIRARLNEYTHLADSLTGEAATLQDSVGNLSRTAAAAAQASEQVEVPVLARASAAAAALAVEAQDHLQALPQLLRTAHAELIQLRVVVAMCVLHSAAVESFAADIAKGEGTGDAMTSLDVLCTAMERTVGAVEREWKNVGQQMSEVAAHIDAAAERLATFQRMLLDWRNLVVRFRLSGQLSNMLGDVDSQEVRSRARMKSLRELSTVCRDAASPLDLSRLARAVASVRVR